MKRHPLSLPRLAGLSLGAGGTFSVLYFFSVVLGKVPEAYGTEGISLLIPLTFGGFLVGQTVLPLARRFSPRRILVGISVVEVLTLLAAAAAPSSRYLLACSFGMGLAAVQVGLVTAVVNTLAAPGHRERASGRFTGGWLLGFACAQAAVGWVADTTSARIAFLVQAAFAAGGIVAFGSIVPDDPWPREATRLWHLLRDAALLAVQDHQLRWAAVLNAASGGIVGLIYSLQPIALGRHEYSTAAWGRNLAAVIFLSFIAAERWGVFTRAHPRAAIVVPAAACVVASASMTPIEWLVPRGPWLLCFIGAYVLLEICTSLHSAAIPPLFLGAHAPSAKAAVLQLAKYSSQVVFALLVFTVYPRNPAAGWGLGLLPALLAFLVARRVPLGEAPEHAEDLTRPIPEVAGLGWEATAGLRAAPVVRRPPAATAESGPGRRRRRIGTTYVSSQRARLGEARSRTLERLEALETASSLHTVAFPEELPGWPRLWVAPPEPEHPLDLTLVLVQTGAAQYELALGFMSSDDLLDLFARDVLRVVDAIENAARGGAHH